MAEQNCCHVSSLSVGLPLTLYFAHCHTFFPPLSYLMNVLSQKEMAPGRKMAQLQSLYLDILSCSSFFSWL